MRIFGRKLESRAPVPVIGVADLKRALDRGDPVVVLDVRQPDAYRQSPAAIPGSIRIPPGELPERFTQVPQGRPVVTYCT